MTAKKILEEGINCIGNRASERDQQEERSMMRTVNTFNALTGHALSEKEGWMFMACLKMARSMQGSEKIDDYVDGAAYIALAGECVSGAKKEIKDEPEVLHMTEAPILGARYWILLGANEYGYVDGRKWDNCIFDFQALRERRAFATKELRDKALERRKNETRN